MGKSERCNQHASHQSCCLIESISMGIVYFRCQLSTGHFIRKLIRTLYKTGQEFQEYTVPVLPDYVLLRIIILYHIPVTEKAQHTVALIGIIHVRVAFLTGEMGNHYIIKGNIGTVFIYIA